MRKLPFHVKQALRNANVETQTTPAQNTIIRMAKLAQMTGLSRSSIYNRFRPESRYYDPNFPKPVSLGSNSIGFYSVEVQAWIDQLGQERG